ncbi:hypothetical protein JTB14_034654 [Gonioctena quinquepunctata]|nr:hypothetical protein JTB14_034654 [Gonioctena quinquepunctata]
MNKAQNKTRAAWQVINSHQKITDGAKDIKTIRNIQGEPITDPKQIADPFNSCFCEVDIEEFTGETKTEETTFLDSTYGTESENIIMQLKAEKLQGVNGIPGFIINRCFQQIEEPLFHLINKYLELGSLLFPTLVLIMNNDLPSIAPDRTLPIMYADDSNLITNSKYPQNIAFKMKDWSKQNGLSLNNEKSQIIHFEHKNKPLE